VPRAKDPEVKPIPLADLRELVDRLMALDPTGRAKAIRNEELAAVARASVAAAGDEAIWQMKRGGKTYADVMADLGYADRGPVVRAISRHNRRRRGEL
jgi:hypothetical protein